MCLSLEIFFSVHKLHILTGTDCNNLHRVFRCHRIDACPFFDQFFQLQICHRQTHLMDQCHKGLYFQKCFISVAAADLNAGYMVDTEDEAELYQILMQHSEQTTLLLDYSKFGQRALVPLCPLHEIRTVISNIQMPEAYKSYYFDHGVTVFTTIKDL